MITLQPDQNRYSFWPQIWRQICQSVELQRRVSLGEYIIKMDPDVDIEKHFMYISDNPTCVWMSCLQDHAGIRTYSWVWTRISLSQIIETVPRTPHTHLHERGSKCAGSWSSWWPYQIPHHVWRPLHHHHHHKQGWKEPSSHEQLSTTTGYANKWMHLTFYISSGAWQVPISSLMDECI